MISVPAHKFSRISQLFSTMFLVVVIVLTAGTLFTITNGYTTNIVFMDEVDIYSKLIEGYSLVDAGVFFHGSHKLGPLFFLEEIVLYVGQFDSNWIAYLSFGYIIGAFCAFSFYYQKNYKFSAIYFAIFPIIFFTAKQWESIIATRVVSYGVAVLFLIFLLVNLRPLKHKLLFGLTVVFLTLTGFGYLYVIALFVALLLPVIRNKEGALRKASLYCFGIATCIFLAFFPFQRELQSQLEV